MAGRSIEWEDQGPEGLKRAAQLLSPKGQPLPPQSLSQSSCVLRLLWKPGPQAFLPTQLGLEGRGLSAVTRGCGYAGCVPIPPFGSLCPHGGSENPWGPACGS